MALSPLLSLGPLCPSEDAGPAWEALPVFDLGVCLLVAPLAGREDFKPRVGSHTGTGYKSNFRPVVSCQASLEALDNPARGYGLYGSFPAPALLIRPTPGSVNGDPELCLA